MPSYLLQSTHLIALPPTAQPTARDISEQVERALRMERVDVERLDELTLRFRPSVAPLFGPFSWNDTLALVARGEVEVQSTASGPQIRCYLQPRLWLATIPVVQIAVVFGWAAATSALRWGVGLGGFVLGGIVLGWAWINADSIFQRIAEEIRVSYAKQPSRPKGAA